MALVVTMGDPAGIGPEVTQKAWETLRQSGPEFFVIGCSDAYREAPLRVISSPSEAAGVFSQALPVLGIPLASPVTPGQPALANAAATLEAIRQAASLVQEGSARGMITAPINKAQLYDGAGFAFPGHTEYLAHLAGAPPVIMMLASPVLRVVPATVHIPLSEVAGTLTPARLEETIRLTDMALRVNFGITHPRLAVAGLNPHAGEGGALGREECDWIAPLVKRLQHEGFDLRGPLPADTMFHPKARAAYDAAICMYHDQALIPLKALDFDRGVNVTLGLPFVRTSPDHGTGYDIAGRDIANPSSMIAAIRLAHEMALAKGA